MRYITFTSYETPSKFMRYHISNFENFNFYYECFNNVKNWTSENEIIIVGKASKLK